LKNDCSSLVYTASLYFVELALLESEDAVYDDGAGDPCAASTLAVEFDELLLVSSF